MSFTAIPPMPELPNSPPRGTSAVRPSTAIGNNSAPSAFRKGGHSPSPSANSFLVTSPSTNSLASLGLAATPSAYSLSGIKSRLSTKNKAKRSFTSTNGSLKPNASISPPSISSAPPLPPLIRPPTAPGLRTQKSMDSLTTLNRGQQVAREQMFTPPLPPVGIAPSLSGSTLAGSVRDGVTTLPSMYETIHEVAEKRINTLDYLRRAHEGRVYWYNTVKFSKADLSTRVHPDARKLSRRATNYFVLGQSIPSILEIGAANPLEYLKAFNQVLTEYEAFAATHPTDGSSASSSSRVGMGRVRLWGKSSVSKPRRGSSATQGGIDGLYHFTGLDSLDRIKGSSSSMLTHHHHHSPLPPQLVHSSSSTQDLEGEDYVYLINPSLPFEPDFYETFATLCDVLIDAYARVLSLINSPEVCAVGMGESFLKADAKIRKVVVGNVAKEFEDASRNSIRSELAGLAKSVLGNML